ncbi:HupE/UreJ family protein [Novosphingobium sp. MMS21-SN21R]|uniref:HupE/UreJ family protein n=1 Tax=Novosphingobium sp. MMS21-SN21R TaxID=2969298 RepID=UPI002886BD9D|nr:HupE/UreJ family protein [Novosphingobium sp. MMS21-SN21R]MDT0508639.1 HupE/UreJ family protein [Novosphingobium sp. MMS21-SN21R]
MISIQRRPTQQRASSGSATIKHLIRAALALVLALLPGPALAHLTPNSEIRLAFAPGAVTADIVVPQGEFAYATGLSTDNRPASLARAKARVMADMAVLSPDGRPWTISVNRIAFETIAGPPDLHLTLTLTAPPGASDRKLLWRWHVVTREAPNHFALLVIGADLAGGLKGERELVGALTATRPELLIDRGHAGLGSLFANAFRLGAHHIAQGYDHLLFLLALLLPAPLLAAAGRWTTPRTSRDTFKKLAWIVTAFTIGHSATLILAAFLGLRLPAQPVEAGIALSVLVSAIHAARPVFPGREPLVAGLFGLVHGLAFATLVSNFGLGMTTRATAILGFNLGIEAVQLGIVVLAVPLLLALARWKHGASARLALAALTGLAALFWLAQRLGPS